VEAVSANPTQELVTLHRFLTSLVEMFFTTIGMVPTPTTASITTTNVSFCYHQPLFNRSYQHI
jgi:uncharacterized membrane protein